MHCPFKEKRAKTRREATISYYSQQPCPPKAMTTCFYCKQYYYLWPIKAQGLCIMRLSHILQKWRTPGLTGDQCFTGPVSPLGPQRVHPHRTMESRGAAVALLPVDCSLKLYDLIDLVRAQGIRRSGFRTDQTDHTMSVTKKQKYNSKLLGWFSPDHGPFRWWCSNSSNSGIGNSM